MTKITVPVKGMTCASCATTVTHAIKRTTGVADATVSIANHQAVIEYDPEKTTLEKINDNVKPTGYSLDLNHQGESHLHHADEHLLKLKKQVRFLFPVSLIIFIFLLWDAFGKYIAGFPEMPFTSQVFNWGNFLFATLALFIHGQEFLAAIPRFIKTRAANMDTLIGIGVLAAYLYSAFVIFFPKAALAMNLPEATYFDVVTVVIGFIKYGKFLEANSKAKTGQAIRELLKLTAKVALVVRLGQEIEIPIDEVKVGDTIIVKPGGKIPVDGLILEGHTSIDESMITGEPIPVDKTIGERVVSGTINKQGYIKFKADKVGADTLLSQIIKMVENAQSSRAPIERLVDTISGYFVPAVLGLAVLAFIIWFVSGNLSLAISAFVGILVIACPCALGLATPTAIIVSVGKGAQNGILIKDAETLQKLHQIDTVVFDKTGTITTGQPQVAKVITAQDKSEKEVLSILASLEKRSDHPLAKAIVDYALHPSLRGAKATKQSIPIHTVQNFKDIPGKGIAGQFKKERYLAGNLTLLQEHKVKYDVQNIKEYTSKGMTPVFLFSEKKLLGAVFISDTLKTESKQAIADLHDLGIKTVMLTGDDHDAAAFIAGQAGIDRIYSQVLPDEKAHIVSKLKEEGAKVAMVGDGVNDSPALATADVGIAMSTGTDVAIESAGITLLHGDLSKVKNAIKLSKQTMTAIKQNLFWAFIYNVVGIPIAAGLLYPLFGLVLNPAIAGAAMAFSSVSVVGNSLRLKSKKL